MRHVFIIIFFFLSCFGVSNADDLSIDQKSDKSSKNIITDSLSEAYWKFWNPKVQAKIDQDIEKNRKADAVLKLEGLPAGTAIKVEQISHDFIFGAQIFNFNQLGTEERNRKYKELFGTIFNSATIAFYWKKFEMQPNRPRFREEYWDTEFFWNRVQNPRSEPHWRRPATDPVVEFCEEKNIRLHGHTIIWCAPNFSMPRWIFEQYCPDDEKEKISRLSKEEISKMSNSEIEALVPTYFKKIDRLHEKRMMELANYYGGRIQSWDVVNESAEDYYGSCLTGDIAWKSGRYGLVSGDYPYKAFRLADKVFPKGVLFNINDYANDENYVKETKDLLAHGCRIDIMGSQMHLSNPKQCLDVANGKPIETPQQVWDKMEMLSQTGLPIHLSEISINSVHDDEDGRMIQAIMARNLYRLWFSIKPVMGITWWNVVDDCSATPPPTTSGLFTRNMEPKPAFYALDNLINNEWKTNTIIVVGKDGIAKFRGFKGRYRISWKNSLGEEQDVEFYLKNDGDGL